MAKPSPKHIILVAGEASGDMHGANLVKAIHDLDSSITFSGLGGQRMAAQGIQLDYDLTKLAIVGFVEVLKHYKQFKQIFNDILIKIRKRQPSAVILIDYPGFNLRLAKKLHTMRKHLPPDFKIIYYISPQVWAWKKSRVHMIKKCIDQMLVIFQFEKDFYAKFNIQTTFIGHPLIEAIEHGLTTSSKDFLTALELHDYQITIGILPGSREKEIERHLPVMLEAAKLLKKEFPMLQFLLIKAATIPLSSIEAITTTHLVENIKIIDDQTYNAINACNLCMVASGTATLETAILQKPMIVIYKTSWPTWILAKLFVKIPNIGLVNVIAQKRIVPECVQHDATAANIAKELKGIFKNEQRTTQIKSELQKIKTTLTLESKESPSHNAAKEILNIL